MGIPCACIPVGSLYPLCSRFLRNCAFIPYRSARSWNVSRDCGTFCPFAVTRCRGMADVDAEGAGDPSSSSSCSSSENFCFLFAGLESSARFLLELGSVFCAYLKKSNSEGSSREDALAFPFPLSTFFESFCAICQTPSSSSDLLLSLTLKIFTSFSKRFLLNLTPPRDKS